MKEILRNTEDGINAEVNDPWQSLTELAQNPDDSMEEFETLAERSLYQDVGEKALAEVNLLAETENSPENTNAATADIVESWDTPAWIENLEREQEQQLLEVYQKAQQKGLLGSVSQKVRQAIGGLARKPRSAVAILLATTVVGGAAGTVNTVQPHADQITQIETEVEAGNYLAENTEASGESIAKVALTKENQSANPEITELDNGDTISEVMAAMKKVNYEIDAEFTPEGEKLYERTYFKKAKAPGRPAEIKDMTGTTHVHNHPNNAGFSASDLKVYAAAQVAQGVVVTDKYVYIIEPDTQGWPSKAEITQAFKGASKKADTKEITAQIQKAPKSERSTLYSQKKLEILADDLGMNFTILDNRESEDDRNPSAERFFSHSH